MTTTPPPVPPVPPVPPPPGPRPQAAPPVNDAPITDAWVPDAPQVPPPPPPPAGSSPAPLPPPPPTRPPSRALPRAQRDRRPYKAPSGGFRALIILVGGVLTLLVLSIGTLTIADTLGRAVDTFAVSFPAGIRKVVIDVDHGSIELRGTDRADIRGERTVTRGLQVPAYEEHVDGDTLTIESACPVVVSVWCEVGYSLEVPADVELDLTDGAGRIEARGFTGATHARSGAGSVRVDEMSGRLDLRSGAGSVNGTRLTSPVVSALSGAGSVNLEFAAAPDEVRAEAGAGSVDIEVPRDGTTYRIESDHGPTRATVGVATDPQSSHVINARSGGGSVRIHHPAP